MFEYGLAMFLCAISGAIIVVIVTLWTRTGIAIKSILFGLAALLLTGSFAITWPPFVEGKMSLLGKSFADGLANSPLGKSFDPKFDMRVECVDGETVGHMTDCQDVVGQTTIHEDGTSTTSWYCEDGTKFDDPHKCRGHKASKDVRVDVADAANATTTVADATKTADNTGSVVTDAEYAESQRIFQNLSKEEQERRQKIAQDQVLKALSGH